jgi:ribulose-5-phosphate 4-epimerase/fuculose-1-phosphate aldolase
MESTEAMIREKLVKAWHFFYKRGFIDGFGHISARASSPEEILVSPFAVSRKTTPGDFLLMDLEGRRISGEGPPPGELSIHLEIYKVRPDVGSIAHFHGLFSTAFTTSDQILRPIYFLASIFRDGIPTHSDSRLINNRERGIALGKTLGQHRAALLKAHGVVVTGGDVEEMVGASFLLEDNAHRAWISAAMGNPVWLDPDVMAEVEEEMLKSRGPFRRIWALCESDSEE